jgi:hypothetical protein
MKRFLILLIVVVMAVPTLFADVTVGAWGRIILTVDGTDAEDVNGDAQDPTMETAPNWGGAGGRVGFVVKGSADKIGFVFNVNGNVTGDYYGSSMGVGDELKIWVKPIEMLKISAGRILIDSLRGKFGMSSAAGDHLWVGGGDFEDKIFARNRFSSGLAAELTPMAGVTLNAGINYELMTDVDADPNTPDEAVPQTVEDTVKTVQISAGYAIEGIGLIRAQYIGENTQAVASEDMQVAFALTMVEGLLVDLGLTIDLADPDVGDPDDPYLALGASYQITDAISAALYADVMFSDMLPLFIGLTGSYSMGDVSLNAELGFNMMKVELGPDVDMTTTNIEIYPYARMGLGNGYCSAGVKISMNSVAITDLDTESVMKWQIPVVLEYWF